MRALFYVVESPWKSLCDARFDRTLMGEARAALLPRRVPLDARVDGGRIQFVEPLSKADQDRILSKLDQSRPELAARLRKRVSLAARVRLVRIRLWGVASPIIAFCDRDVFMDLTTLRQRAA